MAGMYWRHKESLPGLITKASMQTAQAGTWHTLEPTMRIRQMRMFSITTLLAASMFNEQNPIGKLEATTFPEDERNAAGSTIARTIQLMIPPKTNPTVIGPFETFEGAPATVIGEDVGEPITLTTVLLVTACAVAAGFIAHEVALVMDNKYFQEEKTKRLVAETSKSVEMIAMHVEREKLAGKLVPFSDEERTVLRDLQGLQKEIAAEKNRPFPSPFDGAREFIQTATGSAALLLPLALGAFALFAFSSDSHKETIHVE
jgi:hypothetical protein